MKRPIVLLVSIVLLIITVSIAAAQSGGGYDLTWSTIDGGGSESIGSSYTLVGTIGQLDAGPLMNGEGYLLTGGFWGEASQYHVYLPLMIK
jgi:hypothetical protein